MNADLLILLSDVDGIYTGPPDQENSRLIDVFRPGDIESIKFGGKSRVGLGGMESKVCYQYILVVLHHFQCI